MYLNLTDEQLKTVIADAIVKTITPESRDELFRQAIAGLLKPNDYSKKTPVQEAFEFAVQNVARKMIEAELAGDSDTARKIRVIIEEATEKAFVSGREKLVERLADSIAKAMAFDRY